MDPASLCQGQECRGLPRKAASSGICLNCANNWDPLNPEVGQGGEGLRYLNGSADVHGCVDVFQQ